MKQLALTLAAAVSMLAISGPAQAQQRTAILVVDTDRILNDCTACKAAATQLQAQVQAGRTRAQQIETSLKPEAEALQKAVQAANGKPDAALQSRILAFQTKQRQGESELSGKQTAIQSIQAHIQQQLGQKIVQIVEQSRARRQASLVVAKQSTLANDPAIDITGEVLTALNQQLPAVSVTPMPQQPKPQGR
jgi:Skp family chaperone for outer membrane proteins